MARIAVIAGHHEHVAYLQALLAQISHDVRAFEAKPLYEREIAGWRPHLALFYWDFEALDFETRFGSLRTAIDAPLIVVGSAYEESAVVRALKLGADGCLCRPFSRVELMARITASLRRFWEWGEQSGALAQPTLASGISSLAADVREPALSPHERRLLDLLRGRNGNVVSRDELCKEIWGCDGDGMYATLSLCVHSLRKKLERNPHHPQYILTKWGVGYYLAHEIAEA
jgi:DNA-binding response OmpR family regulator